jgi:hypothetical protein
MLSERQGVDGLVTERDIADMGPLHVGTPFRVGTLLSPTPTPTPSLPTQMSVARYTVQCDEEGCCIHAQTLMRFSAWSPSVRTTARYPGQPGSAGARFATGALRGHPGCSQQRGTPVRGATAGRSTNQPTLTSWACISGMAILHPIIVLTSCGSSRIPATAPSSRKPGDRWRRCAGAI